MANDKNVSKLSSHILEKKKGVLASPWNHSMREANINFQSNSWARDRLPEYLWMGLILTNHGRKETFNKLFPILKYISTVDREMEHPKISKILSLPDDKQEKIYERILDNLDKSDISPLTVILNGNDYPIFYRYFNDNTMSMEKRLEIVGKTIRKLWNHQSNEATDIRFLALCLLLYNNKIQFSPQSKVTAIALAHYPNTEHDDERMRSYRPSVRSFEGIDFGHDDYSFSKYFWNEIGMLDECKLIYLEYPKGNIMNKDLIEDSKNAIDYTLSAHKEISLNEDKFSVLTGSLSYALKIYEEIITKDLGESILGRHGSRTIIELIIILKYLIKEESNKPDIWSEYKQYGIGKYKLILLKSREKRDEKEKSHFCEPLIDILVNELGWEEYQDVDLKYFDKTGIREKSIEVGEKDLYDILYDYDSNYVHGLWGAVRESSLLTCDNPNHKYHSVPDIFNCQKQSSVLYDSEKCFMKLLRIYHVNYAFPEWFADKYLKGD
jgi:hypothetical protein